MAERQWCVICSRFGNHRTDRHDTFEVLAGEVSASDHRRSSLDRNNKSGHIFTLPGEPCWCGDEHYERSQRDG